MAAKNGGGRPSKLTAEVVGKILTAIRSGATYEHSCLAAGITYQSFRNWIQRGEAAKSGEFFEFFEALKRAEGEGVILLVGNIKKAANNGRWQAAAWILERRYPEIYGRQRIELTGKDGGPIKTDDGLSDGERAARLMAFVDAARKARSGRDSGG